jgi:hypothetical protein
MDAALKQVHELCKIQLGLGGETLSIVDRYEAHHTYVVCWNFDPTQPYGRMWENGTYCNTYKQALKAFSKKIAGRYWRWQ